MPDKAIDADVLSAGPRPPGRVAALLMAALLSMVALGFTLMALVLWAGVEGEPVGFALIALFAYAALCALGGTVACVRESRRLSPSALRSMGAFFVVGFGISAGFAAASFVERSAAHGAFEGVAVAFGAIAIFAILLAGLCYLYAGPGDAGASAS